MSTFEGFVDSNTLKLKLSSYNVRNVDSHLYLGCRVRSPFAINMIRSTWLARMQLPLTCRNCDCGYVFDMLPTKNITPDFLLNIYYKWTAPKVCLKNTPADVSLDATSTLTGPAEIRTNDVESSTVSGVTYWAHDLDENAGNWTVAQNTSGLTPLVTANTTEDSPFGSTVTLSFPRHRVYWTKYLATSYFHEAIFKIQGAVNQPLDRPFFDAHTQYYVNSSVRPQVNIMRGFRDTLITPLESAQGTDPQECIEDTEPLYYLIPFSWSVNRFVPSLRVEDKSSNLPIVNLWGNLLSFELRTKENITDLLIFERERITPILDTSGNVADIFVSSQPATTDPADVSAAAQSAVSIYRNIPGYDANALNVLSVSGDIGSFISLGIVPFGTSTGEYVRVCRASDQQEDCTTGTEVLVVENYIEPIDKIASPKMFGDFASVNDTERFLQRFSCRNREILLNRVLTKSVSVSPGSLANIDLTCLGGAISHLFLSVENETAALCGDWSNYTNDALGFVQTPAYRDASLIFNGQQTAIHKQDPGFFEFIQPAISATTLPDHNCGIGLISEAILFGSPFEVSGSTSYSNGNIFSCAELQINTKPSVTREQQLAAQMRQQKLIENGLSYLLNDDLILSNQFIPVDSRTKRYRVHVRASAYTMLILNAWRRVTEGPSVFETFLDEANDQQYCLNDRYN